MGMADVRWPSSANAAGGEPERLAWHWRHPERPFFAPYHHGQRCRRVSLRHDSWRCAKCHVGIKPERLHHRLLAALGLGRLSAFGAEPRPWRHLVRVYGRSPWRVDKAARR